MDKAQSHPASEAPAAPQEERSARHARMLARAAEIQMEVMEATRTEAVETPQPGVDYCARIAVITKSLRLTLLLEESFASRRDERRKAAAKREAARRQHHVQRVKFAVMMAPYDTPETDEGSSRRAEEIRERLERPEVAELVEVTPAEIAVETLSRYWGYPPRVKRWLEAADKTLERMGVVPPEDDEPWPGDPPEPRTGSSRRKPKPPDTG
jgi:hypothetical protein